MADAELVDRLVALSGLAEIPRDELEWLVARGSRPGRGVRGRRCDRSQRRAHREALDYPLRAYRHPCGSGSRTPAGHGMADGRREWNAALLPADPIAR